MLDPCVAGGSVAAVVAVVVAAVVAHLRLFEEEANENRR